VSFIDIREYGSLFTCFIIGPRLPSATIRLKETREYPISMVGTPNGTGSWFLDLNQRYYWIVKDVALRIAALREKVKWHGEGYTNEENKECSDAP
jgi:hypothetical protein